MYKITPYQIPTTQKKNLPAKFPIPLLREFSCLPLDTIWKTLMMGDIHLSLKLKKYFDKCFLCIQSSKWLFIIIKMPAPLVLSINNRYTGLIRANINDKSGVRENILMEGGYFLTRVGGKYHLPTLPRKLRQLISHVLIHSHKKQKYSLETRAAFR